MLIELADGAPVDINSVRNLSLVVEAVGRVSPGQALRRNTVAAPGPSCRIGLVVADGGADHDGQIVALPDTW